MTRDLGTWLSALVSLARMIEVLKIIALICDVAFAVINSRGFLDSLITLRIRTANHSLLLFFSAEEMLNEKDEEDGHSENDEEHSDEETHTKNNDASNDQYKEEDKEENTFLRQVCETLVDNIKLLKTRAGRAGLIHNFLRGLSVPSVPDFSGL